MASSPVTATVRRGPPAPYVPAIGPILRVLLWSVFVGFAFLGATGVYLSAISLVNAWAAPRSYTTPFALWMLVAHIGVGVIGTLPFLVFGLTHWWTARRRKNRLAVKLGVMVFGAGLLVVVTGFALIQLDRMPQLPTGTVRRSVVYWLHIVLPVVSVWLYIRHRQAGPPIRWKLARGWGIGVGGFTVAMLLLHSQNPQKWYRVGPKEGDQYFEPSMSRTADGTFISADVMMMDDYCAKCHADVANDHFHSAHKFSSFNNPAYLFSVRETRKVGLEKDGSVKASRWCAGCHDPVPFLSGAFDDPKFDDVNHKTAHAGITCTSCHAITHVNGTFGNGAYTMEEPAHYPFAASGNPTLQWINQQLVKAKPDFHKQTFLKPFHKSAEFCATCHKVSLPSDLNHYKEFLRGQNHYDSFLLSGVSGHGVRSFYYPPTAKENCNACHMPLKPSDDFGAKDFDKTGVAKVHNHRFPGANTGLFTLLKNDPKYTPHSQGFDETIALHEGYLKGGPDGTDKKVRIDIFGLKTDIVDTAGLVKLRPELPALHPGKSYVIEVVIRTLALGHHFSQGTVDSNEIWVDFRATSGGREIARNGGMTGPDAGEVDRWAHFVNVHMLDRNGHRINRRNPQDIFTPLYDKQIAPGAAAVLHYRLDVPSDVKGPVELSATLRYRKFDDEYLKLIHDGKDYPKQPIVDVCQDHVTLPLSGGPPAGAGQQSPIKPAWQRWNDYGIGNLLEGGGKRGNFKQAEDAFRKVVATNEKDALSHGHLNLARTFIEEGRLDEAAKELDAAGRCEPPASWWSRLWFTAQVNSQNAGRSEDLLAVIAELEKLLDPARQPTDRGFDFTKDYVAWNFLANLQFKVRKSYSEGTAPRREAIRKAIGSAERVLALDAEDVSAHDLLALAYGEIAGDLPPVQSGGDSLAALAAVAADTTRPIAERVTACQGLASGLTSLNGPKLSTIRDVMAKVRPAFHAERDGAMQSTLARVLAVYHRESHEIYKPDEVARSNATRIYRAKNPAANYATGDRVIYPTTVQHRAAIVETGKLPPSP